MELHKTLMPKPGERQDSVGAAVRSNAAWRDTANAALLAQDELAAQVAEWKREAHAANAARLIAVNSLADAQEACERLKRDSDNLALLMRELSGLTLGQLPRGAYGGALASLFCDIKRESE